jgi:hypothetical protein
MGTGSGASRSPSLRQLQRLPTPEGLRVLAEDYAADPASPEGIVGFLHTAANEIELSRKTFKRLKKKASS